MNGPQGLNARIVEWRPVCRAVMFEVVRRRNGSVAIRVQCRRCSGHSSRPVKHEIGIDELLRAVGGATIIEPEVVCKSSEPERSDQAG